MSSCSVETCSVPVKRAGFCYSHYMKNWRYGTPTPEHAPRWTDITGQRFGKLTAVERSGSAWSCRCDCGVLATVRAGDLNKGQQTCGTPGCRPVSTPRRSDAGYHAAHSRVTRDKGKATTHACIDCGGKAQQWSYDHEDLNERISDERHSFGMPYSLSPDHYEPRCVPCHKAFDRGRLIAA